MTSPAPGSTLTGASVTFHWNSGSGVSQYWLYFGTTSGGYELYSQSQGTNLSMTMNNLPTNGQPVYVRLWSLIGTNWQFNDYTYTGANSAQKAVLVSPAPNSTLPGATASFTWSTGTGVSQYWLYFGTTAGGYELYSQSQGTNHSMTMNNLPTDGRAIYVRLWSLIGGAWQFNDTAYTAATAAVATLKAAMTSPAPNSTLSGATASFSWSTGSGVSQYWLYFGTTAGGYELYSQSQGTNLSMTMNNLPTNGQPVYVRLWSLIGTAWQFNDYTYTTSNNSQFVLGFPLQGYTPYTAPIASIFDHSMNIAYDTNGIVVAMNGDSGTIGNANDSTCMKDSTGQLYFRGLVNGRTLNYVGAGSCGARSYLTYDGHPGYDYAVPDLTPVFAAISGTISWKECPVDGSPCSDFGRICIRHSSGNIVGYLHLQKQIGGLDINSPVQKGQLIGYSGHTDSQQVIAPHLHFEVRKNRNCVAEGAALPGDPTDPYGWWGTGADPYTTLHPTVVNTWLWQ
jgi:murein DD-endopeptidase MepM/ murein hydrolase activator NlpD